MSSEWQGSDRVVSLRQTRLWPRVGQRTGHVVCALQGAVEGTAAAGLARRPLRRGLRLGRLVCSVPCARVRQQRRVLARPAGGSRIHGGDTPSAGESCVAGSTCVCVNAARGCFLQGGRSVTPHSDVAIEYTVFMLPGTQCFDPHSPATPRGSRTPPNTHPGALCHTPCARWRPPRPHS